MQSLFGGGELGLLGGGGDAGGLKEDGCGSVAWHSSQLPPDDVYSASHFALITAYQDIKTRLACLERENTSIKRKLKIYEIKFPMINEFGEDTNSYCSFESKETALLHSENGNLQQRVNVLTHELQKRKEREEQLEDVIQAYEKIHMEKSNLQRDLDKMTSLVEKHVERILGLESALRQRENSLQKLNMQLHSKDMQYLQLHAGPDTHMLDCPALTLQSSRSLDALSDLKLQRLEAELEGARHEAQGACQREEELKGECERLKEEMRMLQNSQRDREMTSPCKQCDVEWIKKVGDEQVNLALAYTELTEELGRLQALSSKQTEILRKASQEQASPVQRHSPIHHQRHSPVSQRHSPISQRHSPVPPPQHHSPIQQRRSPVLQRLSPDMHRRSPLLDVNDGPASYSCRPPSQHLRASFQGRRSYSEVADPSAYQCPPRFSLDPVSTLPKPRPYIEGYAKQQPQHVGSPHAGLQHRSSPSPHQGGAGGDGGHGESSMRHSREMPFPLSEVAHLHFEPPPPSTPAPQPPQSSEDEEEWTCPHPISPPRTLGVLSSAVPSGVMRGPASCSVFPIPQRSNTLSCHPQPGYMSAEHAQSWPSINLWMETEESDMRSCPLCQLIFPVGYPDDALIKHIDSHLENSKI
ncbi:TANK-binding kinase 1-binding protein 1 [Plectropomus leopardus]|uniref:TANK-binding kinase 1-binding protein 1 n=1 Tax=Plectropomus leopardus TaxID=160734 RepID=UPI001C4B3027|nr:TANK-binding kinase 1-binding protein 1 [Plectropomus leopardus]